MIAGLPLEAYPGVDKVLPILRLQAGHSWEFRKSDTVITIGETSLGGGHCSSIAGPCSVESREQLLEAAAAAKAEDTMLRGGAFKPALLRALPRPGTAVSLLGRSPRTKRPAHRHRADGSPSLVEGGWYFIPTTGPPRNFCVGSGEQESKAGNCHDRKRTPDGQPNTRASDTDGGSGIRTFEASATAAPDIFSKAHRSRPAATRRNQREEVDPR